MDFTNMILEIAEEMDITMDFDELMTEGMRFVSTDFTDEENRDCLRINL